MTKKPLFIYGWIILALSFLGMAFAHGARNSFSVFYVPILDEFGWTRASTIYYFYLLFGVVNGIGGSLIRSILQKNCNIVSFGDPV